MTFVTISRKTPALVLCAVLSLAFCAGFVQPSAAQTQQEILEMKAKRSSNFVPARKTSDARSLITGLALQDFCTRASKAHNLTCDAYIRGVIDYHNLIKGLGRAPSVDFCVPPKTRDDAIRSIVIKYLQENKQHDNFIAAPGVAMALFDEFPCKTKLKHAPEGMSEGATASEDE